MLSERVTEHYLSSARAWYMPKLMSKETYLLPLISKETYLNEMQQYHRECLHSYLHPPEILVLCCCTRGDLLKWKEACKTDILHKQRVSHGASPIVCTRIKYSYSGTYTRAVRTFKSQVWPPPCPPSILLCTSPVLAKPSSPPPQHSVSACSLSVAGTVACVLSYVSAYVNIYPIYVSAYIKVVCPLNMSAHVNDYIYIWKWCVPVYVCMYVCVAAACQHISGTYVSIVAAVVHVTLWASAYVNDMFLMYLSAFMNAMCRLYVSTHVNDTSLIYMSSYVNHKCVLHIHM